MKFIEPFAQINKSGDKTWSWFFTDHMKWNQAATLFTNWKSIITQTYQQEW